MKSSFIERTVGMWKHSKPIIFALTVISIIAVSFLFSYTAAIVRADNEEVYTKDGSYDLAVSVLTDYYNAADLYQDTNPEKYISNENVRKYITGKIEAKNYQQYMYGTDDKQDYKVSFELRNAEKNEDTVRLFIAAKVAFCYRGLNMDSGYGEQNIITLKKEEDGYSVIGWYCPGSDYDSDISENWEQSDRWTDKEWEDILTKQKEINARIRKFYTNES
jgi:hypothetical protein